MVEALSFFLAREREALAAVPPRDVVVPVQELLKIARSLLVARAGMDMAETTDALKQRISARPEHGRPDYTPSLTR